MKLVPIWALLVLLFFGPIEAILLRIPLTDPWNWMAQVILLIALVIVFLNWLAWLSLPAHPLLR